MYPVKQSTALTVPFFVHDASGDPVTGLSDGSFTKRISKGSGAFGAMTVTITEMENGWYSFPLSTTHSNTLGILSITFTNAGAKQVNLQFRVHVRLPDDLAWPTTTGRSIDVLATGEIPIDFDTSIGNLAAAQIEASALDGKGDWNVGKTGYSLTQSFPTNFADMSITVTTGLIDITQTAADKVWSSATRTLTAFSTALALSVWNVLESAVVTASSMGLKVKNNLNAVLSDVEADTQNIQSRLPATLVGGAMDSDVSAMQAGVVTAAAVATNAIDADALAADAVIEIRDAILPVQNVALDNIEFLFVAASDHVTPVTGATGTAVTRSIDGGAFGAGTGTLAEVANGIYQYDASAADMNGGKITFRFTGTGGTPGAPDDAFVTIVTGAGV